MSIGNDAYRFIEFGFAELRGVYPARQGFGSSFTPAPRGAKNWSRLIGGAQRRQSNQVK